MSRKEAPTPENNERYSIPFIALDLVGLCDKVTATTVEMDDLAARINYLGVHPNLSYEYRDGASNALAFVFDFARNRVLTPEATEVINQPLNSLALHIIAENPGLSSDKLWLLIKEDSNMQDVEDTDIKSAMKILFDYKFIEAAAPNEPEDKGLFWQLTPYTPLLLGKIEAERLTLKIKERN